MLNTIVLINPNGTGVCYGVVIEETVRRIIGQPNDIQYVVLFQNETAEEMKYGARLEELCPVRPDNKAQCDQFIAMHCQEQWALQKVADLKLKHTTPTHAPSL